MSRWIGALVCLTLFWICAYSFLHQQSIWTDEASQMAGLSLGPFKVVQWLLGKDFQQEVPFDRMPPLSYWIGEGWASLFGLTELSMRLMGLTASSLALLLTFCTAQRLFGSKAAFVAGLLFASSPNLIITAVEIRSYPLFLLWSSLGLYFFAHLLTSDSPKFYAGLAFSCLAAIYTHYYGFILTLALISVLAMQRRKMLPLVLTAATIGILSLGVIPFILEAFHQSSPDLKVKRIGEDLLRLDYRLLFHASIISRPILFLGIFGAVGLMILAIFVRKGLPFLTIVAIGLVIVALADASLTTFAAASPSYNIWMIPSLLIFLSSALSWEGKIGRHVAPLFAGSLLLCTGFGAYELTVNGVAFSHGPYNQLKTMIEKQLPAVALVYEGDPDASAMARFAVKALFKEAVQQFLKADISNIHQRVVLVIKTENQSAEKLQEQLNSHIIQPLEPGPFARQLMASSDWQLKERKTMLAMVKLEVMIFEKK